MTIEEIKINQCSGCSLCANLCPQNSIVMQSDEEGFLYPTVDHQTCIDCGLCLKKCPSKSENLFEELKPTYYAINIRDKEDLKRSSSGGVFIALAKMVLAQGGYVCGCVYDDTMKAVHVCTNDLVVVKRMMGSKYVQSNIYECLDRINDLLAEGNKVLFTGTACQVAAVKTKVKYDENLILVDVLCHGVPSPLFFDKYVKFLENKYQGKVVNIDFRNKNRDGWGAEHRTYCQIEKLDKLEGHWPILPAYFCAFFWSLNLRESCYNCHFAGEQRISDLTIGDFWGSYTFFNRLIKEGISIVSVNSQKGSITLKAISDSCEIFQDVPTDKAKGSNTNFYHPTVRPQGRTNYYVNLRFRDYRSFIKQTYFDKGCRKKFAISLYGKFCPKFIKNIIRNLRH